MAERGSKFTLQADRYNPFGKVYIYCACTIAEWWVVAVVRSKFAYLLLTIRMDSWRSAMHFAWTETHEILVTDQRKKRWQQQQQQRMHHTHTHTPNIYKNRCLPLFDSKTNCPLVNFHCECNFLCESVGFWLFSVSGFSFRSYCCVVIVVFRAVSRALAFIHLRIYYYSVYFVYCYYYILQFVALVESEWAREEDDGGGERNVWWKKASSNASGCFFLLQLLLLW